MSRRSLAEPERLKLLEAVRAGVDRATAAAYISLTPAELEELLAADDEFATAVEAGEAAVRVGVVASVMKAAKGGNVAAANLLLERVSPTAKPKCGARRRDGLTCRHPKGFRTDLPGFGKCYLHGGRTANGRKHAQTEAASAAVAKLGIPLGTGDPFELLETATKYSRGLLEASAQVLVDVVDGTRTDITLEAAAKLHVDAIRQGATTGHQAVTADVASRQAKISEQLASVVMAAVQNGIGAYAAAILAGKTALEAQGLGEAAAADILDVQVPVGAGLN